MELDTEDDSDAGAGADAARCRVRRTGISALSNSGNSHTTENTLLMLQKKAPRVDTSNASCTDSVPADSVSADKNTITCDTKANSIPSTSHIPMTQRKRSKPAIYSASTTNTGTETTPEELSPEVEFWINEAKKKKRSCNTPSNSRAESGIPTECYNHYEALSELEDMDDSRNNSSCK